MKSFILKTILFILSLFVLLGVVVLVSYNEIDKKAEFKISETIHSIILGHSHPEMAYNDTLINGFKNLGHSGESYFYTYYKLQKVIAANPQIKSVYVEFSNNQIESLMDDWIWGDEFMNFRYPIYGSFLDLDGQSLLLYHNTDSFLNAMSVATYDYYEALVKKDFDFLKRMGGYEFSKREKLDSLLQTDFEHHPKFSYTKTQLSAENINYLQKIIEYCHNKNLEIILIRSPQYKRLPVLRNETYFQNVKDSLFSDLKFLDFNEFQLEINEFGDLDHLNYRGAHRFSKYFNEFIQYQE